MQSNQEVQITLRGPERCVLAAVKRLASRFTLMDTTAVLPGRFTGEWVMYVTVSVRPGRGELPVEASRADA